SYDSLTSAWTIGTVDVGQTLSLSLTASVDIGTTGQSITNTASVNGLSEIDLDTTNDSASVAVIPRLPFLQDPGLQGVVSLEAESYHASAVAPDGHAWLSAGTGFPGFSGVDAMQALPEDSVNHSVDYSSLSPQLDFQVNFVDTGTHYVWLRAWAPSSSSNSAHVGLNGQEETTSKNLTVQVAGDYVWVGTRSGGARATLTIGTAGVHTINLWMRESGTVVDKVVLTTDSSYDPSLINSGLGPDESIQGDPLDTDADGMLDSWEVANFGDLSRDGTGDFDVDGATDLEEHDAGTNPLDPASFPVVADGDINGNGQVEAADVLIAQRILHGLYLPTAAEFQRGDVAPLIGGVPSPDGQFNLADLLIIQRKALGLVNF
ncbi:MAG: hypothetical protein KJO10_10640, partial [Gammaproteobacteria bacterium]|nr:hypothetical protein [Gammaproteobacteria bacterium]